MEIYPYIYSVGLIFEKREVKIWLMTNTEEQKVKVREEVLQKTFLKDNRCPVVINYSNCDNGHEDYDYYDYDCDDIAAHYNYMRLNDDYVNYDDYGFFFIGTAYDSSDGNDSITQRNNDFYNSQKKENQEIENLIDEMKIIKGRKE